jgi:uncharacterized protein YbcI
MDTEDPNKPDAASELTDHDWTKGVEVGNGPGMRVEISNAMVGLKKSFYGRGPTKAKTYINDNYVLCVLEGGLTKNEQTLLAAGEAHLVRQYRLRFQEVMADATTEAVERITGCKVVGYHSQIVFEPEHGFEIFVLDRPPE